MSNTLEGLEQPVALGGHINPQVDPLTEKERTFGPYETTIEHDSPSSKEKEFKNSAEGNITEVDEDKDHTTTYLLDPFVPFDNLPEEKNILTLRALFVGLCCGALVNASNVYLGLKTGWTFGANLFGAIVGFAVVKAMSRTFKNIPIIGGDFGPRENNIIQTAAMASGGLSSVFVSAFPAMYQLNLMDTPERDYWRIVALTAVGGYFGFFFATPLRKFFIIYVARELRMVFPTPSATAMTIRAMHEATTGEILAKMKMKGLSIAFSCALVLRVVSQYAVGLLWDWHPFVWFHIWGNYHTLALAVDNWGWYIEFTPAFIGSGMLVGLNVALSFFGGSVLAWGIIGPALVHNKVAFGIQSAPDDPKWKDVYSFWSLGSSACTKDTPSPRYWLLWPGVLLMVVVAFVELLLQWRVLYFSFKALFRAFARGIYEVGHMAGKEIGYLKHASDQAEEDLVEDPAKPEELVKLWMWLPGLVVVIIAVCVVFGVQYDMPVGMSLLSVFLAFFFAFMAIQCTGVTDTTPLTAASKASQIVLGSATKGENWAVTHAQKLNLLGGAMASMGANQSSDLVSDFRTGFLLRTPPVLQWIAQGLGTIVAVFFAPALFMLFAKAYPCILDAEAETCAFLAPSVSAWRAVAIAATNPDFPIPQSSGIFAIVFAIFGGVMVVIRHYLWTGKLEWVRKYHPNMMTVGLAFVLPQTVYGTAMVMGAIASYFWAKKNPKHFDIYGYAVAAGLIAGEGIGGVVNAIFQIAGISGDDYGTNVACPGTGCP